MGYKPLTVGARGVDEAFGWPGGANLAAWGAAFHCGYYSWDTAKDLTVAKCADAHAHGVATVGNWEAMGTGLVTAGVDQAAVGQAAAAIARSCGQPTDRPIYYSLDEGADPSLFPLMVANLRAREAASGYPAGLYAEHTAVDYAAGAGVVWLWQANAWNPPGTLSPHALICQQLAQATIGGVVCDVDVACAADIGQWGVDSLDPIPPPPPSPPVTEETPVILIQRSSDKAQATTNGVAKAYVPDGGTLGALEAKLGAPVVVSDEYWNSLPDVGIAPPA